MRNRTRYEVQPGPIDGGEWFLYEVGDGGDYLVAKFSDKEDAEFAALHFNIRERVRANS